MRICQVLLGKMLGYRFGGAERLFADLCMELNRAGAAVLAICRPDFPAIPELQRAGVSCEFVTERSSWDPLAAYRIRRAAIRFQAQLIHTHLSRASRIARWAHVGVPLVTSIHHYGSWRYYRGADYYLPVSRYGETYLRDRGVPARRIGLLPNFTTMPPVTTPVKTLHSPFRLLAYGRFVEEKGFQDLIEACRILKQRDVDYQLVLGGDGPYADLLHAQIDRLGLRDRIRCVGWIDDVVACLDWSDLFVLPSRKEPFGLVLLEAMARGVPVVTTRAEGPAEFLSDREVRFSNVADPASLADEILAALTDDAVTRARVQRAFALYREKYTPASVIPGLMQSYENLIAGGVEDGPAQPA